MSNIDWGKVKTPETDLAEAREAAVVRINLGYREQIRSQIDDYPEEEVKTWTLQHTEAAAYLDWLGEGAEGDEPPTPVLSNILTGRDFGESMEELCNKVVEKSDRYAKIQQLTGRRHALIRKVEQAETVEQLKSVSW